jgi:imidazolonepropionase-like amidohydrolase
VPIAFGTDAGVGDHGKNACQFELLVEWGGFTQPSFVMKGGVVYVGLPVIQ